VEDKRTVKNVKPSVKHSKLNSQDNTRDQVVKANTEASDKSKVREKYSSTNENKNTLTAKRKAEGSSSSRENVKKPKNSIKKESESVNNIDTVSKKNDLDDKEKHIENCGITDKPAKEKSVVSDGDINLKGQGQTDGYDQKGSDQGNFDSGKGESLSDSSTYKNSEQKERKCLEHLQVRT
jgi:hypothetical protein